MHMVLGNDATTTGRAQWSHQLDAASVLLPVAVAAAVVVSVVCATVAAMNCRATIATTTIKHEIIAARVFVCSSRAGTADAHCV
jgi:hypothetical protein